MTDDKVRRVRKARLVPDTAPDGLTEKVVLVSDLGVPIAAALGEWGALTDEEVLALSNAINGEWWRRISPPEASDD